jgi:hypothetical protein
MRQRCALAARRVMTARTSSIQASIVGSVTGGTGSDMPTPLVERDEAPDRGDTLPDLGQSARRPIGPPGG